MLVLVMAMGFGNTCTFSRISNIPRVIPRLYEWVYKILRLLHLLVQLWVPNEWNQGYSQSVCSQLCEFCVKNDEGKVESIILLIFLLWGCFNCWWMRGGEVGQKILFRGSLNRIFCLLLRLQSRIVISPSNLYDPGFDQENEEGRGVQDFLLLPQEFQSFPSDWSQARWANLVRGEYL